MSYFVGQIYTIMNPPGNTVEELLEMDLKTLNAMTPSDLEMYLRPSLEKQAAIISTMPPPKGPLSVNLRGRGSNAVANAIVEESLKQSGITPDMLARFGVKIKL